MEAFCLLQLQRPSEVIDILEPVNMQSGSPEPLLASAYRAIGNDQEAKKNSSGRNIQGDYDSF